MNFTLHTLQVACQQYDEITLSALSNKALVSVITMKMEAHREHCCGYLRWHSFDIVLPFISCESS